MCNAENICPAGRGNSSCTLCQVGFYSEGGTLSAPKAACTQCPSGLTTPSVGATSDGACTVIICDTGKGGLNCQTCPNGTFSSGGNLTVPKPDCQNCPAGTWTSASGSNSSSACVDLCEGKTCTPTSSDICKVSGTCNMYTGECTQLPNAEDGALCTVDGKNGSCLSGSCGECCYLIVFCLMN